MKESFKSIFFRLCISLCLAAPVIYILQDKLQKYNGKIEVLKNFTTAERIIDLDHDGYTEELSMNNIDKDHFYGEVWNSKALLGILSEQANLLKGTLKIKDINKDSIYDYSYVSCYHDTLFLKSSSIELKGGKIVTQRIANVPVCQLIVKDAMPECFKADLVDVDGDTFDDYVFTITHTPKDRAIYYYNFRRKKLFKTDNEFMHFTDFHCLNINSKNVLLYTTYANANVPESKLKFAATKFGMDSLHSEKYYTDHNAYIGYLNKNLKQIGLPKIKKGFTGMIRAIPVLRDKNVFYYTCETYINEPDSEQSLKILDQNLNTVSSSKMVLPYKNDLYHKYNREVFQKIVINDEDRIILCGRNDSVYELTPELKLELLFTDANIHEGSKVKQTDLNSDGIIETLFFSSGGITIFNNGLDDQLFVESSVTINSGVIFDKAGAKESRKGYYLRTDDRKLVFLVYEGNSIYKFKFLFILFSIAIIYFLISFIIKLQTRKLEKEKRNLELIIKDRTKEISAQNLELGVRNNVIEEKQKEILDSIHYAKRIQSALLINDELINHFSENNFILFQPKDIVSGDFYWSTEHNGKLYLAVCDSTGHGVPGAFMSLLNMGFLNEAIKEKQIEKPNEIFDYVRMRLINSISKEGQKDGMDGILVCYDPKNRKLEYSAANNVPLLIRHNEIIELDKDRMPVGKGELEGDFKPFSFNVQSGDVLYLYTDGYADQFGGPKGKKFKYRQLNELLLSISNQPSVVQLDKLHKRLNDWKGSLEQVDDILVIGIRF